MKPIAAINIANKGLNDLYSLKSEEYPDYIRGDFIRPMDASHPNLAKSMKRMGIDIAL